MGVGLASLLLERLLRLRLSFFEGEPEKRDCFLRKVRRLESVELMGNLILLLICSNLPARVI